MLHFKPHFFNSLSPKEREKETGGFGSWLERDQNNNNEETKRVNNFQMNSARNNSNNFSLPQNSGGNVTKQTSEGQGFTK